MARPGKTRISHPFIPLRGNLADVFHYTLMERFEMPSIAWLLLCFLLALPSWAGYQTLKTSDPQTNTTTFSMRDNKLGIPKKNDGCRTDNLSNSIYFDETHVQLLLEKTIYPEPTQHPAQYRIQMNYQGETWMFLKQINFLAGGETTVFKISESKRSMDDNCREDVTLTVDAAFLDRLATSSLVLIQLVGRDQTIDLCFNDTNRKNVNQFIGDAQ